MNPNADIIKQAITGSLQQVDQDREREIISRRFGLSGSKETLEQIGEMLGVTRERVRQLEKAILIRLSIAAEAGKVPELIVADKLIKRELSEMGRIARATELSDKIFGAKATRANLAALTFISTISPALTIVEENDKYYCGVGIADYGNEKAIRGQIDQIVATIKEHKAPMTLDELDDQLDYEHPDHIRAIASLSKLLSSLDNLWGLSKWPTVNPKNIRDKIYVILDKNKTPMHFADIAKAIAASDFRRKNVTTQAIHNELIKDKRFILVGRGIYALDSWGYSRGTVSDVIADILEKAGEPLTRDEIVKRVLQSRQVKETTILLNLQNRGLFTRIDKNTYTLAK
jgi:hypothetical protein